MAGMKIQNEYALDRIAPMVYGHTPKAVFAALCVSLLDRLGVPPEQTSAAVANEWAILTANGITQALPASVRAFVNGDELEGIAS